MQICKNCNIAIDDIKKLIKSMKNQKANGIFSGFPHHLLKIAIKYVYNDDRSIKQIPSRKNDLKRMENNL